MKKAVVIATTIGFGLFMIVGNQFGLFGSSNAERFPKLPDQPGFEVAKEFDGEWVGRRVDVTGNNLCERTTITGNVKEGLVRLTLTYNGTSLKGWIDEQGGLTLYATNRQWDYRFTGQASGNQIKGRWYLTNGPCKGSWLVERQ